MKYRVHLRLRIDMGNPWRWEVQCRMTSMLRSSQRA
jgi:hypothetical protein